MKNNFESLLVGSKQRSKMVSNLELLQKRKLKKNWGTKLAEGVKKKEKKAELKE